MIFCVTIHGERKVLFVSEETTKKEKAAKPRYNMAQNTWFMVKTAWQCREKKVLVLCLLLALTSVASSLISLYTSPVVLGALEKGTTLAELLGIIAAFTGMLMLVNAAKAYMESNVLYGRVSVRMEIIAALNKKAASTCYPNLFEKRFDSLSAASYLATEHNRAAAEGIWDTLTDLLKSILGFAVYVALMASVQPAMVALVVVTTVISYFASKYANEWGYRHKEEQNQALKEMNYIWEKSKSVAAAKDIRIFGLRGWIDELLDKASSAFKAYHAKMQSVYVWANVIDLVLTFLRNGLAYAFLIGLVLEGKLTVAEFLLYFTAVDGFAQWVNGILGCLSQLHKQSLELNQVRDFLDYPEPFNMAGGEPVAPDGRQHEIRLENLSFRYPGAEKDTLHHINLTLHPGEKLAVVGLNGAGKTTLIKLICGFLDPTEGKVLLDGRDVRTLNRRDYYTMFSAVFQQFSLLPGTVAANVAQSPDDIDMERVKQCVAQANLKDKVESLPNGYETNLNREVFEDAVLLSGGETQRLMLARALYKDAPFVILDEPTAALDPIAESEIYQKYNEMTGGKSSIFISHRLASTRFCDRIIMIGNGGIEEEGTHDQLLQKGGSYAQLFEVQSQYYKEGVEKDEEGR